ncbi:MAG: CHAT domain-containing tetratricopeptide repeat protein [Chitinophagales bacterium]
MSKQTDLNLAEQFFEEAQTLSKQAKYEESIKLLKQAIVIYEKWELWEKWVEVGNKIGLVYRDIGEYEQGIAFLQNILKVAEQYFGKDSYITASSIHNIGIHYQYLGDNKTALKYYQKALALRKKKYGDEKNPILAFSYNNIGICYLLQTDYDLGIFYFQEALKIRRESHGNEDFFTAGILDNLGSIYSQKGMYDTAIRYSEEALVINKKIYAADHPAIAFSLHILGIAYWRKKDYLKAIIYLKEALKNRRKFLGNNHSDVAKSLEGIGICYHNTKDFDLGVQYLQQAIDIKIIHYGKQSSELATLYLNIGNCHEGKKDYEQALNYFQKGLIVLNTDFQDANIYQNPKDFKYVNPGTLSILYSEKSNILLKLYQEQGQNPKDLQAALATAITACDFIADLRKQYKTEGAKHTLAEEASYNYNIAIEVAMETYVLYQSSPTIPQYSVFTNIPSNAKDVKNLTFDFSEQCKATLLLSNLKDNEAKAAAKIPADLLEKEKALQKRLNDLNNDIAQQEAKGDEKDETILSQLQSEYFHQKQNYDQLIAQFETDYPKYHQLKYDVSTASIQDLQSLLETKKQTALISYHIADKQIYIFAIASNDYQIATIPKPENFSDSIEKLQNAIQLGHIQYFVECATQLFDLLLKPIWDFLQKTSKLIIIPHGELYYVPFDVLLNQHQITDVKNFENLPYLIRDFDISYHYSATMLLHSHRKQEQTSKLTDSFFGLAPIQFGETNVADKKEGYVVKSGGQQKHHRRQILKSSGNDQTALQDLEETEAEVKEVYQLFEEQGKEAIALFYDQANKKNLQQYIGGYKYVLISTHGFLQETDRNTLSGIHLAPQKRQATDGEKLTESDSQSDNYRLHTSETYHLNLNADLVVLSSCESGIGELKTGEGMMALNRGFLYAGASNIVYSLFKVPQDSTSRLTQALFRYILKGDSYASALRKAKLELIADSMMEPMDWAGFALVGT